MLLAQRPPAKTPVPADRLVDERGEDVERIVVGDREYPSDKHALIAVYPNPLNPERYVVLNSSFTFRDYAYLNNARQVPKLPDWAVVDVSVPASSRFPGKVVSADFFDEEWKIRK